MRSGYFVALAGAVLCAGALAGLRFDDARAQPAPAAPAAGSFSALPEIRGPFVADPHVMPLLDCETAAKAGGCPLNFARLIQAKLANPQTGVGNPFDLDVMKDVNAKVTDGINGLAKDDGVDDDHKLNPRFLTDPKSRFELVGVINRMDRQFIEDPTLRLTPAQRNCGEISLIYRFGYAIDDQNKSRLPVTMNLVFPALPSGGGTITCADLARRWLQVANAPHSLSAAELLDPGHGALATIDGKDILRLELNMQAYRKPASVEQTLAFGSQAKYLIRVFVWNAAASPPRFTEYSLRDQIDRDTVLCGGIAQCAAREPARRALVRWLQTPAVVADIDNGTLEIPEALLDGLGLKILSRSAVSLSPGGGARSGNQPYWKAPKASGDVITDKEIRDALKNAKPGTLSFVKSVDDFRTRLNESSCTGCHQTRAIAGFHFPGADRDGTAPVNGILLPGSPQFYGDQPRRMEILWKIANGSGGRLAQHDLATSYSTRPMNRFSKQAPSGERAAETLVGTQLIGGWGGTCLMPDVRKTSQRQWDCKAGLTCRQMFRSDNTPGIGTCVPDSMSRIGDPLQIGVVTSASWGRDQYHRLLPIYRLDAEDHLDTSIPSDALPQFPSDANSYYGAHQEFYTGLSNGFLDKLSKDPAAHFSEQDRLAAIRDQSTGGFPGGMLRLSECNGLPGDATCGLVASTGFNDCIGAIGGKVTITSCLSLFTSYAGMRACDAADPCRDDYICAMPIMPAEVTTPAQMHAFHDARIAGLKAALGDKYNPRAFGQTEPDLDWMQRNDRRGICIPPYFVFQFRADGHPKPG
jgi:hypothetical protein